MRLVALSIALTFSSATLAQQGGTAQEARAMLDKAVAAVRADRDLALGMFNKGEGGFRDRDLYPFCARITDGKNVAGPLYAPIGTDLHTIKDSTGKLYGLDELAAAQKPEGQFTEITYMAPKPGTSAPEFQKVSFMTKVGDLVCGVGYYTGSAPGQTGAAEEARAMLNKAIAAVKADRDVALAMFNKGEGGFRDRDLYPFCIRLNDGKSVAGPVAVQAGTDIRTLKDSTGTNIGAPIFAQTAQKRDGELFESDPFRFPKPGTTTPEFTKVNLMMKVGDLVCGVGYFK